MARQRASQARAAFARVGTAPVPTSADDGDNASVPASGNDGISDGYTDVETAVTTAITNASSRASADASDSAVRTDGGKASGRAGRGRGKKAGRPPRRVGRPRGPARVPLTVRILAATDERLTAAVEATGQSPQYIVDAALGAYLDALGITRPQLSRGSELHGDH